MTQGAAGAPPLRVGPNVSGLAPYHAPAAADERGICREPLVRLGGNENPLGPSPAAIEAIRRHAGDVSRYPDAHCVAIRAALSAHLDVSPEWIVVGNGSDDLIHLLGLTFLEPGDEVIVGHPSFVRYRAAAMLNSALCREIPLDETCTFDLGTVAKSLTDRTRVVFIANTKNPTGTFVSKDALSELLTQAPERVIIVLDEAYFEYAQASPGYPDGAAFARQNTHVVALRTFSKAYGLAGLRIGYGVLHPDLAAWVNRVREPFHVNSVAQAAAIAALGDQEHLRRTLQVNEQGKRMLGRELSSMGLSCPESCANFLWVDVKREASAVCQALLGRGVVVRSGEMFGAPRRLRVTIGTESENVRLMEALRAVLSEAS